MKRDKEFVREINGLLAGIEDGVVSADPFAWSNTKEEKNKRETIFRTISEKISSYRYVPETRKIITLICCGLVPLAVLGALFWGGIPEEDEARLIVWGGLGLVSLVFFIGAVVVGSVPDIDEAFVLAAYAVPRGWSFSQTQSEEAWEAYAKRFSYFDTGDENQHIGTRLWGFLDKGETRPFQCFHFHYDTVTYETVTHVGPNNTTYTTVERRVHPHDRWGIFVKMPEAKTRIRITEIGGDGGLETSLKLEYAALNKAVDVYYNGKDELAVRQFLSPAVQETIFALSQKISDMVFDVYSGLLLCAGEDDFFSAIGGMDIKQTGSACPQNIAPSFVPFEQFLGCMNEHVATIVKYNDNY